MDDDALRLLGASQVLYQMIDDVLSLHADDVGAQNEVNKDFTERVKEMSHMYKSKYAQIKPNFDDELYRLAYLYEYFPINSFGTYKLLQEFSTQIGEWFQNRSGERTSLNVCCIGGGPGTELLALAKFLKDYNMLPAKLKCTILDAHSDWEQTWNELWAQHQHLGLPDGFELSVKYVKFDLFGDHIPEQALQAVHTADIVTMTMTFSRVVFRMPTEDEGCWLKEIFHEMKEQSLTFYFDLVSFDSYRVKIATKFRELLPQHTECKRLENFMIQTRDGARFEDFEFMKQFWFACDKYHQMAERMVTALLLEISPVGPQKKKKQHTAARNSNPHRTRVDTAHGQVTGDSR